MSSDLINENFTSSFSRLRQQIAPKSVPHEQHDSVSTFNQSDQYLFSSFNQSVHSLFFHIQPIRSLICGVIDVAVVIA